MTDVDADGNSGRDDTERVWLVEREYDDGGMVTLTYATPDGKRRERTQFSAVYLESRSVTAARDVPFSASGRLRRPLGGKTWAKKGRLLAPRALGEPRSLRSRGCVSFVSLALDRRLSHATSARPRGITSFLLVTGNCARSRQRCALDDGAVVGWVLLDDLALV
ncbi:hypothetical protein BRD18_06925 [Halobacteriales archaeon SW_7_71_33]|nr:MAG: hypothetical protein BRD18_06925 [Halobacteriales archaeon SW_7_71_33]